jgi:hypothetical protein
MVRICHYAELHICIYTRSNFSEFIFLLYITIYVQNASVCFKVWISVKLMKFLTISKAFHFMQL